MEVKALVGFDVELLVVGVNVGGINEELWVSGEVKTEGRGLGSCRF